MEAECCLSCCAYLYDDPILWPAKENKPVVRYVLEIAAKKVSLQQQYSTRANVLQTHHSPYDVACPLNNHLTVGLLVVHRQLHQYHGKVIIL